MAVCAPTNEGAPESARESFEWYPRAGARLTASVADMQADRGEELGSYGYAADMRQVADDGSGRPASTSCSAWSTPTR